MAKQGNYVTIPGMDPNWAKGISSALTDLSSSYNKKAALQEQEKRLAANEAENKRRYEEGLLRQDERNALLDERYKNEQALAAEKYQNTLTRQAELDRIAADERARAAKEREVLSQYAASYSAPSARQAILESDPELKTALEAQNVANREALASNAIIDATMSGEQGRMLREQAAEFGPSLGLTKDAIVPEDAVGALEKARAEGKTSPMLDAFSQESSALQDRIDAYIASNAPIYREQEQARVTQELIAKGADPVRAAALATQLSGQYSSEKDLTAQATARQKAEQASAEKAADLVYKALKFEQDQAKSSGNKNPNYITPGTVTQTEVQNKIESIDPGIKDAGTLRDLYDAAVAAGVNEKIALKSLEETIADDTWLGIRTKGPKLGTEDFLAYAKAREASNSPTKIDTSKISRDEFIKLITPESVPYVDPRTSNREAFVRGISAYRPEVTRLPLVPFGPDVDNLTNTATPLPSENSTVNANGVVTVNEPVVGPDNLRRDPTTGRVLPPLSGAWGSSSIPPRTREAITDQIAKEARIQQERERFAELARQQALAKAEADAGKTGERIDIYKNVDIPGTLRQALTPSTIPNDFSAGNLDLNPNEQRTIMFLSGLSTDGLRRMLDRPNLTAAERKVIPLILQSRN